MNKIHYLIIEDNQNFLTHLIENLKQRSDFGEITNFTNAEDALRSDLSQINFLIVDYKLPGMDGVAFLGSPEILKKKIPKLILTGYNMEDKIFEALRNGAIGFLFKDELGTLGSVIDILLADGAFITPTIALRVVRHFSTKVSNQDTSFKLTTREKQILEELTRGEPLINISKVFEISIQTVRQHIKNIYKKLEVSSRIELMKRVGN